MTRGFLRFAPIACVYFFTEALSRIYRPHHHQSDSRYILAGLQLLVATVTAKLFLSGRCSRTWFLWLMLVTSLVFQAGATAIGSLGAWPSLAAPAAMIFRSYLLSPLSLIPLLVTAAWPSGQRDSIKARLCYGMLPLGVALDFFLLIRTIDAGNPAMVSLSLTRLFLASDLFLSVVFSIRILGAEDILERHFFYVTSIYLWISTGCEYACARLLAHRQSAALSLLMPVPSMAFLLLLGGITCCQLWMLRPSLHCGPFCRAASPLVLGFGLTLTGFGLIREHYIAGVLAILTATLACGTLSVIADHRRLADEAAVQVSEILINDAIGVDGLTQLLTRKAFLAALLTACHQAQFSASSLSLLLIRIDDAQALRETFGRLLVDHYISEISLLFRRGLDERGSTIARIDAGTFGVLLQGSSPEEASQVAHFLVDLIQEQRFEHPGTISGLLSLSFGVSSAADGVYHPTALMDEARRSLGVSSVPHIRPRSKTYFLAR